MKDFQNLVVWQKAHQLTLSVYRDTRNFPSDERFGVTSQLRRSVSSIPANIAEGCGRGTDADFARFLQIAMGSASETEYHLRLSRDLSYLNQQQWDPLNQLTCEVKRMLAALLKKLKADR
ncbi:hypothetical protein Mal64_06080 [Pseudobythopirellula maris]|uniref:Four helix bundle protein n=1 Tax=Pseudobythopirellula maris TaxID=2527991 RepID=A0A5C5ZRT7_9BACT|nr:four helix bundle protein [Pseudobythopirellula maris]TWT90224.1 hypothetical protein Mal64_06080 [Pseudobythopirellula maris]